MSARKPSAPVKTKRKKNPDPPDPAAELPRVRETLLAAASAPSPEAVTAALALFERHPGWSDEGVWEIVHGIEKLPPSRYAQPLLKSFRSSPSYGAALMLRRLLNAGTMQIDGTHLAEEIAAAARARTTPPGVKAELRSILSDVAATSAEKPQGTAPRGADAPALADAAGLIDRPARDKGMKALLSSAPEQEADALDRGLKRYTWPAEGITLGVRGGVVAFAAFTERAVDAGRAPAPIKRSMNAAAVRRALGRPTRSIDGGGFGPFATLPADLWSREANELCVLYSGLGNAFAVIVMKAGGAPPRFLPEF